MTSTVLPVDMEKRSAAAIDVKSEARGQSRAEQVRNAIKAEDWDELEALSILPGGFQDARIDAWLFLLGVDAQKVRNSQQARKAKNDIAPGLRQRKLSRPTDLLESPNEINQSHSKNPDDLEYLEPHKDERQVGLDTERSFVLYSVDDEKRGSKDGLKAQLHHVIVTVLRRRPKLSYFQGYHDILSVLLLTFIEHSGLDENGELDEESVQLLTAVAEKLSLHRLRDSMGPGLEPLLGLLRLVKQLLRAVDRTYSDQLSAASPLPFYALSNILTFFSHDVPTLALVQHIFDYLLARPPVIIVYLTTVMLLARKEEVQQLYETGDEGMIHALLCTLPELIDEEEEIVLPTLTSQTAASRGSTWEINSKTDTKSDARSDSSGVLVKSQELSGSWVHSSPTPSERERQYLREMERSPSETPSLIDDMSTSQSFTAVDSSRHSMISDISATPNTSVTSIPSPGTSPTLASIPLIPKSEPEPGPNLSGLSDIPDISSSLDFPPLPPASPTSSSHDPIMVTSVTSVSKPVKHALSLPSLLRQADDLYKKHPPSTLNASQIMGPQSVVFTWCEPAGQTNYRKSEKSEGVGNIGNVKKPRRDEISDDMAEKMVLRPELVVKSYKDEDELKADEEAELAREEMRKRREAREAASAAGKNKVNSRNKRATAGGAGFLAANSPTTIIVVGGAVVVVALGVAIAVYGKDGEWRKWAGKAPWIGRSPLLD